MRMTKKLASFIVALAMMVTSFAAYFVKNEINLHADAASSVAAGTVYSLFTSSKTLGENFAIGGVSSFNAAAAQPFANISMATGTISKAVEGKGDQNFHGANGVAFVAPSQWDSNGLFFVYGSTSCASVIQFTAPADGTYKLDFNATRNTWDGKDKVIYVHKNDTQIKSITVAPQVDPYAVNGNVANFGVYSADGIYLEEGDVLSITIVQKSNEPLYSTYLNVTYKCACEKTYVSQGADGHKVTCNTCGTVFAELEAHTYVNDACKHCGYANVTEVGTVFSLFTSSKALGKNFAVGGVSSFNAGSATPFANIVMATGTIVKAIEGKGDQNFLGANNVPFVAPSQWDSNGLFFVQGSTTYASVIQFTAPANGTYKLDFNATRNTWDGKDKVIYVHNNDTQIKSITVAPQVDPYSVNGNVANFGVYSVDGIYLAKGDVLSITIVQKSSEPLYSTYLNVTYKCACDFTEATCTTKATCKICGAEKGELNANNHTGTVKSTQTSTTHSQAYDCCGAIAEAAEAHDFVGNVCNECGYVLASGTVFKPFTGTEITTGFAFYFADSYGVTLPNKTSLIKIGQKDIDQYHPWELKNNIVYGDASGQAYVSQLLENGYEIMFTTTGSKVPVVQFTAPADGTYKFTITGGGAWGGEWFSFFVYKNDQTLISNGKFTGNGATGGKNDKYSTPDTKVVTVDLAKGDVLTAVLDKQNNESLVATVFEIEYHVHEEAYESVDQNGHKVTCTSCGAVITAYEAHDIDPVTGKCKGCDYSVIAGTVFSPFAFDGSFGNYFGFYGINGFDPDDLTTLGNKTGVAFKGSNTFADYLPTIFKGTEDYGIVDGYPLVSRMTADGYVLRLGSFNSGAQNYAPMIQFTAPADGVYQLNIAALKAWGGFNSRLFVFQNEVVKLNYKCDNLADKNGTPTAQTVALQLKAGDVMSVVMSHANAEFVAFTQFDVTFVKACEHTYVSVDENGHKICCADDGCDVIFTEYEAHDFDANGKCNDCDYQCVHTDVTLTKIDETTHKVTCNICGVVTAETEAHSYTEVVTKPTCTTAGYTTYTCDCGYTYTGNNVDATGHTPGAAANCTDDQICTVCNAVLANKLGHTPGAAANCTDDQICTVCNTVLVEALGHTEGPAANCTDDQICTVCNAVLNEKLGHTPGAEATCTTAQVCTVCNAELVAAKGHTPGAEATCTTAQTCTVCNAELVAAKGHTPGAEATCTTAQVCTVCNVELVAAKGHTPGAEATCTTAQVCTVCNVELVAAKGHTPGAEATCTTAQVCTVCNAELVAAKGHTPGAAATCTTAQTCTVCGAELKAALGHNYADKVVDPTCTDAGYTLHTCTVCGNYYSDTPVAATGHAYENDCDANCNNCGEVREITHKYEAVETKPTCTTKGYTTYTCSCGYTYTDNEVEATGHAYENACDTDCNTCGETREITHNYAEKVVDPTCTDAGYTLHTCTVCGNYYSDATVEALGHTEGPAANCTDDQICTVCNVVLVEALGHTEGPAANCTDDQICTVCNTVLNEKLGHTESEPVRENEVPATLNAPGSYDEVVYCSVCKTELSREEKEIPQLTGAVAEIDGTYYGTLEDAIAHANGKTVKLLENITATSMIKIEGVSFTLDLNGKVITAASNVDFVIWVTMYDELTIVDSKGNGGIVNAKTYGYAILNQGTLFVEAGTFTGDAALWNGYDTINSVAYLNGGIFNSIDSEGALAVGNSGTMYVDGAVINGVLQTYGAFELISGEIEALQVLTPNTKDTVTAATHSTIINGGAINNFYVYGGELTINDGEFIGNGSNGVLYVEGGNVVINGGNFEATLGEDNYSMAVWAKGGNVVINGGTFKNATDGSVRGTDLIYASVNGAIVINGGRFEAITPEWTLNLKDTDRDTASIVVNGGEFVNFDPMNSKSEGDDGYNFVADGKHTDVADGVYFICGKAALDAKEENRVDADCTNDGSYDKVVYCECGKELSRENVVIDALGHTEGPAANCTDDQICTVCNAVLVEALGHTEGPAANCTDDQICTVCNAVLVEALGHTEGPAANCTDDQICTVCNAVLVEALGHTAGAEATCTTAQVCTVCDAVLVAAKGHSYYQLVTTSPTCTEPGYIEIDCRNCGGHFVSGVDAEADQYLVDYPFFNLAPKGHTAGAAATCTEDQTCTVCGEVLVEALGHTEGPAANCTDDQICTVCNAVLVEALGHTEGPAANCTDDQICTVCNAVLVEALGHVPGAVANCTDDQICTVCNAVIENKLGHVPGAAATCTEDQTCTVCNTVIVEALGHTAGAAANCTEDQTCTVCGEVLVEALGHTEGPAANCTDDQTCTVCGEVLVEALGHTEGPAANCTDDQTCTVCGEVLVAAKGHTPGADATVNAPQICTECGEILAPALPPVNVPDVKVEEIPAENIEKDETVSDEDIQDVLDEVISNPAIADTDVFSDIKDLFDEDDELVLNIAPNGIGITKDEVTGEVVVNKLSFNVTPTVNGEDLDLQGNAITFRLPIPANVEVGTVVIVYHEGYFHDTAIVKEAADGSKYVEVTSADFSTYTIDLAHEHVDAYEKIDTENHKVVCDLCEEVFVATEAHELDADGICTKCGYDSSENKETNVSGSHTINVSGKFDPNTAAPGVVVSVNISWENMEFTYYETTSGTWNPETHEYEGATEGHWSTEKGTITVTNHSNSKVEATFEFDAIDGIVGTFDVDAIELPSAEGKATDDAELVGTTQFGISGVAISGDVTLGTITITITAID